MHFDNGALTMITQLPATGANNNFLGFLAGSHTTLYATQWGEHKIYSINPLNGDTAIYAGTTNGATDGDLSEATFSFPNGIYIDNTNNIMYISEIGTGSLRIIEDASLSTKDFNSGFIDIDLITYNQNDTLNISANLSSNKKVSIKLFDITGKEVLKKEFKNTNPSFNESVAVKDFSSGTYILLFSQEGKIISKKLVL